MVDSVSNSLVQSFPGSSNGALSARSNAIGGGQQQNGDTRTAAPSSPLETSNSTATSFQDQNQLATLRQTLSEFAESGDQDINLEVEGLNPGFSEGPVSAPEAPAPGARLDITV